MSHGVTEFSSTGPKRMLDLNAAPQFSGSYTALITPFANGSVDEAAFRKLVDWQIDSGTDGLVPVGTTGESPTLSHGEHDRVIEICIEQAAGRVHQAGSIRSVSSGRVKDLADLVVAQGKPGFELSDLFRGERGDRNGLHLLLT